MQVRYATERKAQEASDKHFNGALTVAQMVQLARKIITSATHIGSSDRSNGGHAVARIIWADINGTTYAVVLDGNDVAKNIATVVSIYDVRNVAAKAKRFNMKEVA